MLFLSHDLGVVRFIADRVAVMYRGKIVEIAPVDRLFGHAQHPYTTLLLSAAPSVHRPRVAAPIMSDAIEPSAASMSGCRFRSRCPLAFDRCVEEEPRLTEIGPRHRAACHLAT